MLFACFSLGGVLKEENQHKIFLLSQMKLWSGILGWDEINLLNLMQFKI